MIIQGVGEPLKERLNHYSILGVNGYRDTQTTIDDPFAGPTAQGVSDPTLSAFQLSFLSLLASAKSLGEPQTPRAFASRIPLQSLLSLCQRKRYPLDLFILSECYHC